MAAKHIVIEITSNSEYSLSDATVVDSPESALEVAKALSTDTDEIMVIGGGTIYQLFLDSADTLYLTYIDLDVPGDTQFPDFEALDSWTEEEREVFQPDDKNPHSYCFVKLTRRK